MAEIAFYSVSFLLSYLGLGFLFEKAKKRVEILFIHISPVLLTCEAEVKTSLLLTKTTVSILCSTTSWKSTPSESNFRYYSCIKKKRKSSS